MIVRKLKSRFAILESMAFAFLGFPFTFFSIVIFSIIGASSNLSASSEAIQKVSSENWGSYYSFNITKNRLQFLVKTMAPRVNLFAEVWKRDPKAKFYGGTSRDFLYWILSHFPPGCDTKAMEKSLLSKAMIDIRDIVAQGSDIDIISEAQLHDLAAEFGIKKIDKISKNILNPKTPEGSNEIDQGYIPLEKILLGSNGIDVQPSFGKPLTEIISGKLSLQPQSDMSRFRKSLYARDHANHPILLALRFVRLLATDYFRRFGKNPPTPQQPIQILKSEAEKIEAIVKATWGDPHFPLFLKNSRGRKWLNDTLEKSFRSFINQSASYLLLNDFGIQALQGAFPESIPSLNQYLYKKPLNPENVFSNLKAMKAVAIPLSNARTTLGQRLTVFHGAGSDEAFFGILRYGAIPSGSGSAGNGLYAVTKADIPFAIQWKDSGKRNTVQLKISPDARIFDLRTEKARQFFDLWRDSRGRISLNHSERPSIYDEFSEAFDIDILFYAYRGSHAALVIKNARVILGTRGYERDPMTFSQFLENVDRVKTPSNLIPWLQSLNDSGIRTDEIQFLLEKIPKKAFQLSEFTIKSTLNMEPSTLLGLYKYCEEKKIEPCIHKVTLAVEEHIAAQIHVLDEIFRDPENENKWEQLKKWTEELEELSQWKKIFLNYFKKMKSLRGFSTLLIEYMYKIPELFDRDLFLRSIREMGSIYQIANKMDNGQFFNTLEWKKERSLTAILARDWTNFNLDDREFALHFYKGYSQRINQIFFQFDLLNDFDALKTVVFEYAYPSSDLMIPLSSMILAESNPASKKIFLELMQRCDRDPRWIRDLAMAFWNSPWIIDDQIRSPFFTLMKKHYRGAIEAMGHHRPIDTLLFTNGKWKDKGEAGPISERALQDLSQYRKDLWDLMDDKEKFLQAYLFLSLKNESQTLVDSISHFLNRIFDTPGRPILDWILSLSEKDRYTFLAELGEKILSLSQVNPSIELLDLSRSFLEFMETHNLFFKTLKSVVDVYQDEFAYGGESSNRQGEWDKLSEVVYNMKEYIIQSRKLHSFWASGCDGSLSSFLEKVPSLDSRP